MENELAAEGANELATGPDFGEKQLARHLINVTPASALKRGYQSRPGNVLVVTGQTCKANERRQG